MDKKEIVSTDKFLDDNQINASRSKKMAVIQNLEKDNIIKREVNEEDKRSKKIYINKEIKEKGFTSWEGITNKMFKPVNHLDDCNLNHYSLQLSIYAYIIKKHNPKLKIGKLVIQHVKFKQVGEDKNGYPINESLNGEPVLDTIKLYELPYLLDEVTSLMMWIKENK